MLHPAPDNWAWLHARQGKTLCRARATGPVPERTLSSVSRTLAIPHHAPGAASYCLFKNLLSCLVAGDAPVALSLAMNHRCKISHWQRQTHQESGQQRQRSSRLGPAPFRRQLPTHWIACLQAQSPHLYTALCKGQAPHVCMYDHSRGWLDTASSHGCVLSCGAVLHNCTVKDTRPCRAGASSLTTHAATSLWSITQGIQYPVISHLLGQEKCPCC